MPRQKPLTQADARALALALPETHEASHMGTPDLRVRDKIFATLPPAGRTVSISASRRRQICSTFGASLSARANPARSVPPGCSGLRSGLRRWYSAMSATARQSTATRLTFPMQRASGACSVFSRRDGYSITPACGTRRLPADPSIQRIISCPNEPRIARA